MKRIVKELEIMNSTFLIVVYTGGKYEI